MVCLGNICRSPLAEGILRHKIEERNLGYKVDSCGTANYHIGQSPDPRSVSKAREYGIDISMLRGRQFSRVDFDRFDRIFAMDDANLYDINSLADNDEQLAKVDMILNLSNPGDNLSVPDPYYGGADGFEHVYQLLDKACDDLLDELTE